MDREMPSESRRRGTWEKRVGGTGQEPQAALGASPLQCTCSLSFPISARAGLPPRPPPAPNSGGGS